MIIVMLNLLSHAELAIYARVFIGVSTYKQSPIFQGRLFLIFILNSSTSQVFNFSIQGKLNKVSQFIFTQISNTVHVTYTDAQLLLLLLVL